MTQEQIENIQETVEWFFSGDWIKEEIKDEWRKRLWKSSYTSRICIWEC
jgi:hypothetical protein